MNDKGSVYFSPKEHRRKGTRETEAQPPFQMVYMQTEVWEEIPGKYLNTPQAESPQNINPNTVPSSESTPTLCLLIEGTDE